MARASARCSSSARVATAREELSSARGAFCWHVAVYRRPPLHYAPRRCGDMAMKMDMASATFSLRNWTVTVRGNHVYGRISGPSHRLDVGIHGSGDAAARCLPHGIVGACHIRAGQRRSVAAVFTSGIAVSLGQSFASATPRTGKIDEYPRAGSITTSAMAEGAIQGTAAMYELPSPYQTRFAFSRFEAAEETTLAGSLLDGGSASSGLR